MIVTGSAPTLYNLPIRSLMNIMMMKMMKMQTQLNPGIKNGICHNDDGTGSGVYAEYDIGDDEEGGGVGGDENGGHLEDARTRTGTRRRLQMRVRSPCTPIQGRRRQYLVAMINMMKMNNDEC